MHTMYDTYCSLLPTDPRDQRYTTPGGAMIAIIHERVCSKLMIWIATVRKVTVQNMRTKE